MKKKQPPIETRFKKGQSGNPGGKRKMDPLVKKIKETTYIEFVTSLHKYGSLTKKEITSQLLRDDISMFEIMFCQIVASAAKGDKDARNVLLDRLWGKAKEENLHALNPIILAYNPNQNNNA